jgi:hypothetical protein
VEPRRVHLVAVKHVMRYVKSTLDYGLCYTGDHEFRLYGYTDSNWAGSTSNKKSTSRCCFSLGSTMTSWKRRKQSSIALSTTEAEYIATCFAGCEAIWLRKLLIGLFDLEMEATVILCDNQSCRKMTENPVFHDKSKHIEIWYHYIRDMVQRGVVKLQYVGTDEQVADVLTKPMLQGSAPPPPRTRSRIALRRGAFLGSAIPLSKMCSLVFEGALPREKNASRNAP